MNVPDWVYNRAHNNYQGRDMLICCLHAVLNYYGSMGHDGRSYICILYTCNGKSMTHMYIFVYILWLNAARVAG